MSLRGKHTKNTSRPTAQEVALIVKRKAGTGLLKVIPYGAQVLASAAAYTLGITATQVFVLRCCVCVVSGGEGA